MWNKSSNNSIPETLNIPKILDIATNNSHYLNDTINKAKIWSSQIWEWLKWWFAHIKLMSTEENRVWITGNNTFFPKHFIIDPLRLDRMVIFLLIQYLRIWEYSDCMYSFKGKKMGFCIFPTPSSTHNSTLRNACRIEKNTDPSEWNSHMIKPVLFVHHKVQCPF